MALVNGTNYDHIDLQAVAGGDVTRHKLQDTEGRALLAPTEASSTASAAHAAGSYFILGGLLYQATADIASGGTIVTSGSGQNCKAVTVGGELVKIAGDVNGLYDAVNGDAYDPYKWESGTYNSTSVGSTLTKTNSASYLNIRKRFSAITSVMFGSKISMKSGYKINLLTVDDSRTITAATGYVDAVTLEVGKKYGAVIKASGDGDISSTAISAMLDVSVRDTQIERNRAGIETVSSGVENIAADLADWTLLDVLSGYGVRKDNGQLDAQSARRYTDYVPATIYTKFDVTCRAYSAICGAYAYDKNKNPLRPYFTAGNTVVEYINQIITPKADEAYFRFSTTSTSDTPFRVLKRNVTQNLLQGKTLLNLGDSIANGDGNSSVAYAHYIAWANGMTLYDYARGGATLTTFNPTYNVLAQLDTAIAAHSSDPVDYVLFEGGTNDLTNNTPTIGSLVSGYDITTNIPDTSTIIGAAETIIGKIRATWPDAKILYVSVHKMPTRDLTNQGAIHDALQTVCDKWSFQMADIFNKGGINSYIAAMLPTCFPAHPDDPAYPTGYDRTHPNGYGYTHFYVPFIEAMMKAM